ncbi:MAG: TIGR03118 family protein [Caulobacteraceae bacterium]|nr:TIGR03118 family protein [Caulobacteraceae bacterium]
MSALVGVSLAAGSARADATRFVVTNLVSDGSVPAANTDPNLINPWGVAYSPGGPFWVSDNNSGVSTLYNGSGAKIPLTVTIAPPAGASGPAAPTGVVFNGASSEFQVSNGVSKGGSAFIFDTEDGTISGWAPSVDGTHSLLAVNNSASHAVYKGLALGSSGGSDFIYAADFHSGEIEQYDSSFGLVKTFTDPTVAAGYAPFDVQVLNGDLYVTYALQNAAKHDDVAGPGNGYVDEFSLDGTLIKRLVSKGGQVNSPWGLDIAPSSFGTFAGDLLVGNFGDGTISAFDPTTGAFEGKLDLTNGSPIKLDDLWALITGNGGAGGSASDVYFTAGVMDEAHGLLGSIAAAPAAPEPATWALMLAGVAAAGLVLRRSRLAVAP